MDRLLVINLACIVSERWHNHVIDSVWTLFVAKNENAKMNVASIKWELWTFFFHSKHLGRTIRTKSRKTELYTDCTIWALRKILRSLLKMRLIQSFWMVVKSSTVSSGQLVQINCINKNTFYIIYASWGIYLKAQEKQIYPYHSKVRLKIVSLLADKGGLMPVINCDADIQTEQQ